MVLHTDQPGEHFPWDETAQRSVAEMVNADSLAIFAERASERWTRAAISDALRIEVLACLGGLYVDMDLHPLKAIDDIVAPQECFLSEECGKTFPGNFIIGAEAGHPALYAAMREINRRCRSLLTDGKQANPVEQTGPNAIAASMLKYARCTVLPYRLFSPWPGHFRWDKRYLATAPAASYGIHLFNTTWGDRKMLDPRSVTDPWKALPITK